MYTLIDLVNLIDILKLSNSYNSIISNQITHQPQRCLINLFVVSHRLSFKPGVKRLCIFALQMSSMNSVCLTNTSGNIFPNISRKHFHVRRKNI